MGSTVDAGAALADYGLVRLLVPCPDPEHRSLFLKCRALRQAARCHLSRHPSAAWDDTGFRIMKWPHIDRLLATTSAAVVLPHALMSAEFATLGTPHVLPTAHVLPVPVDPADYDDLTDRRLVAIAATVRHGIGHSINDLVRYMSRCANTLATQLDPERAAKVGRQNFYRLQGAALMLRDLYRAQSTDEPHVLTMLIETLVDSGVTVSDLARGPTGSETLRKVLRRQVHDVAREFVGGISK